MIKLVSIMLLLLFLSPSIKPQNKVLVIRFSGVQDSIVTAVVSEIRGVYHKKVRVIYRNRIPTSINSIFFSGYDAKRFAEYLSTFGEGIKVVGIVSKPLYWYSMWGIRGIYGMGDFKRKKACVVTTCFSSSTASVSRIKKLILHELGHVYGVDHCSDICCYMNEGDGTDAGFDIEKYFCSSCLKKLHLILE